LNGLVTAKSYSLNDAQKRNPESTKLFKGKFQLCNLGTLDIGFNWIISYLAHNGAIHRPIQQIIAYSNGELA
jgi:hypothetical protein